MSQIDLMKRQHTEISLILNKLKEVMSGEDNNLIAKCINELAGKLTMHLKYEDDYLYPQLLKSDNSIIKNTTNKFMKEMGDLASVFVEFKNKYNTKSKIDADVNGFKKSCKEVIKALEKRLHKEDTELYIHV